MPEKRSIVIAILLVLAVVTIAGCTGTSNTSTTTTTASGSVPANVTGGQNSPPNGNMTGGQNSPPGGNMTNGIMPGGSAPGGSTGSSTTSATLSGVYTVDGKTASETNGVYISNTSDVSGVYVANSGSLTLVNPTVAKTGDTSSDDNSNFLGLNAGVVASSGSTLKITGGTITTSADGANGIFSTGTGTTVTVSDITITTTKDSSRGLDVTAGGTLTATNVTISTQGAHCAAIAADRGGGNEIVYGGTMTTAGEGSPGIYCTGNFTITDATTKATGSEAAVIEGKNSITLIDSSISGAVKRGVMIYQSTSGDASVGVGSFTMTGGSLTAAAGPLFYITNTEAVIKLYHATLSGTAGLLTAGADSWGNTGSNGGTVTFLADDENMTGDITVDNVSSITATLQNSTTLSGAINAGNTAKLVSLSIDSTSSWNVTADSYLSVLNDAGGISGTSITNIVGNGHNVYYDSSLSANSALDGKTYTLVNGGSLIPK